MTRRHLLLGLLLLAGLGPTQALAQRAPNLNELPSDLTVPAVSEGPPTAGKRVRVVNPGYDGWKLSHVLYLPTDWSPGKKYPVIVEYPGNGGYRNALGDVSTGRVEDCKLGYGLSEGRGFIWVCLPFVDVQARAHSLTWWGDADATAKYARETVARICTEFGGDRDRVILAGFSRGAIACGYIGLRDDVTAKLWRAMIVHSHYDGVRHWGYADDDAVSARMRLHRFRGKPQLVMHETSVADAQAFLKSEEIKATFVTLPYPNHTDLWVLKDIPERTRVRAWLADVLK